MAMLIEEFIPLCAHRYHLGSTRELIAVMGWSMGGYGALLGGRDSPLAVRCLRGHRPALWLSYQDMLAGPGDAFDSQADFAAHDVFAGASHLEAMAVLLQCGNDDPFYGISQKLAAVLPSNAHVHFSWGDHTPAYWRSVAPEGIRFAGAALAGQPS